MAKPKKLKVFRTPIGFHDAYVAAPSQKAALEAWGSDANLFARGVAEIVTDEALTAEPLAKPGAVIKRMRGTAAEQIAEASKSAAPMSRRSKPAPAARRAAKPHPKPSRDAVDKAEAELSETEDRHREERRAIKQKIAALDRELLALRESHNAEYEELESKRDRALASYQRAMEKWRQ